MTEKKLLIFDLDGTLIDSLAGATNAVNLTLETFGLPPVSTEQTAQYINHGVRHLLARAAFPCEEPLLDRMVAAFEKIYLRHCDAPLYEGVENTLCMLRENGYLLAVFSNKPIAVAKGQLRGCGLLPLFHFLRADDGKTALKPKPDTILSLLGEAGVLAEQAMLIGDSEADLEAGHRAGISTCFARYGIGKLENSTVRPDFQLERFAELQQMLQEMENREKNAV